MRVLIALGFCCIWSLAQLEAQTNTSVAPEYTPAQVLKVLKQLRDIRGENNPPKLNACLKNSADNRWSDLQAHFYCWLKSDQRACFTGAVDGEFKEYPELKGNYDKAFGHCQQAKGRAYGINFDQPLSRLTAEQGEVFKNLLYRQAVFSEADQNKILENFYSGKIPARRPFPMNITAANSKSVTEAKPQAQAPVETLRTSEEAASSLDSKEPGYPKSCQIKSQHARTRAEPNPKSPVVAVLDRGPIKVTGPIQSLQTDSTSTWYPVEFRYKGKIVAAFLSTGLVDCSR